MEPTNLFYGDRHGSVKDPAGNYWSDVPREELAKRTEDFMKQQAGR
jgi:PhnB protein